MQGSDVIAKQDVEVTGNNVSIKALDGTTHYQEQYKMEQSGLTVALTGTAADIYSAKKAIDSAKDRDNDTLLALQSIKGGLTVAGAGLDSKIKNNQGDTQASIGVNVSIGSQKTERTTNEETHNVVGFGVSAGQNVTIKATGNADKTEGDITVQGSQVQAGKDITLEANRDLNVLGAVNTQHSDKNETTSGSSVGMGVSVGGNQPGISYNVSGNYSHERENADGSNWTQGTVTAGNNLNVKTGQDANLVGGQLKGDSVTADIGHDLNIKSLQDSDNYDYEKLSGSVSGSVGSGWSANLSETKTDMNSKWASVTEQSGIMAGKGGYDVTVDNNTDLKGAVISSKAKDKDKNKLDTGTISFSDIENKADYQVDSETVNIGIGTGLIPSVGAPSIYHNSDSASSTTKSAVEEGTLTVRDTANQQQNVDDLSRNTEDANNPLAQIFDKQQELDKIEQQQLINDIAAQMKDVANKYDRIQAQNEVDKHPELVDKAAKEAYDKLSAEEKAKTSLADFTAANKDSLYYTAVDTQVKNSKENIGGIGSSVNKGIDAATSVITGILTGNIVGGLAGAGAPYIAEQIKLHTGHQESDGSWKMDDPNANLIAHAILGGVVAQLQGNSALAGATGAAGSEKIADMIREQLYDNRPVKDLTESEKQNISNLTQLATGLATALATGGDMGDTGTAVNAGKNAVENNNIAIVVPAIQQSLSAILGIQNPDQSNNEQLALGLEHVLKGMGVVINGIYDSLSPVEKVNYLGELVQDMTPEQKQQVQYQYKIESEHNELAMGTRPKIGNVNDYLANNQFGQMLASGMELEGYDASGNPIYNVTGSGAGNYVWSGDKISFNEDSILVYGQDGKLITVLNQDGTKNTTLTDWGEGSNISGIVDKPFPNHTGGDQILEQDKDAGKLTNPIQDQDKDAGKLSNPIQDQDKDSGKLTNPIQDQDKNSGTLAGPEVDVGNWQNNILTSENGDPAFKNGYVWKPNIDVDLRGSGSSTQDALDQAFNKLGIDKSEFVVTKWAQDKNGKSFPVEYRVTQGKNKGAEVNIDTGHDTYGPGVPHIGFQTPGKNNTVGHILIDDVPVNRTK